MDEDASSNHNRNVSTYPKSHFVWIHTPFLFLQHHSRQSWIWWMWFCRFGYEPWGFFLAIGWICHLHICSRRLTVFLWQMRTKNALDSKDNSDVVFTRPNLDSIIRRLPSRADVCFDRPTMPASCFSDVCLIVCTSPKYVVLFLFQLKCAAITWFQSPWSLILLIWTLFPLPFWFKNIKFIQFI